MQWKLRKKSKHKKNEDRKDESVVIDSLRAWYVDDYGVVHEFTLAVQEALTTQSY